MAFCSCTNLVTTISSSSTLRGIEKYAFSKCEALTDIEFPNTLSRLGISAFSWCDNLKTVTFPDTSPVKSIPDLCFESCVNLKVIRLPDNDKLKIISEGSFSDCTNLSSIDLPNSVQIIGNDTFCFCESLKSMHVPPFVKSIGEDAFFCCKSMEYIKLSAMTTVIQEGTFYCCESLKHVELPVGIRTIKGTAFTGCSNLTTIDFPKPVTSEIKMGKDEGYYMKNNGNATMNIPNSIVCIERGAFNLCEQLEDVIDWTMIRYICDVNRARRFLKQSHTCSVGLRPYVLQSRSFRKTRKVAVRRSVREQEEREKLIRQSSYIFYILIHDGIIWEHQQ